MQVEQRQYFGDLRGLAAPRGQDLGGEPLALTGGLVHAPVVHPGRGDLDGTCRGHHGAVPVVAVADHQEVSALVPLGGQLGNVLVDFGLQCGGQHPPGAAADDLVDQGAGLGGTVGGDYAQHGVPSRPALRTRAYSVTGRSITREGTPVPCQAGRVGRNRPQTGVDLGSRPC